MARASMSLRALEADQVKWTFLSICSTTGPFPTHDACGPSLLCSAVCSIAPSIATRRRSLAHHPQCC